MGSEKTVDVEAERTGLLVLTSPTCLMEFLWYYYAVARPASWDVLILDYAGPAMSEQLAKYCENAGVFRNVSFAGQGLVKESGKEKLLAACRMAGNFLIGKGDQYAKEILSTDFCWDDYDEFVVTANPGLIAGCLVRLSAKKRTVLFEDGFADYLPKRRWCGLSNIRDINHVMGMVTSFMGYGTCVVGYRLKNYRYCIHYATFPDKLVYKNYAETHALYSEPVRDGLDYNAEVRRVFDIKDVADPSSFGLVLFTAPFENTSHENEVIREGVYDAVHDWLVETYGHGVKILVKQHPRDTFDYAKWDDLELSFVRPSLPGEVLIPHCKGVDVVLMSASSIMFQLVQQGVDYVVLDLGDYLVPYMANAHRQNIELLDACSVAL